MTFCYNMIDPRTINGEEIAIFIHDVEGNSGGSAVLFGVARFKDEEFYVERSKEPIMFPIPKSAWSSLKINENPKSGELFEQVPYIVRLILSPMPEGADNAEFEQIKIPILDQD